MDAALKMLDEEGMANVFARHAKVAAYAREGIQSFGFDLLVYDERYASNTVTAVKKPDGLDLSKFLKILRDDHQVILSGGQASLSGKIFRIGHLGYVSVADMEEVLNAIKLTLPRAI
jgi:aspartate aminotransferase-like enzyme